MEILHALMKILAQRIVWPVEQKAGKTKSMTF